MRERPIIFSAPMIRALRENRKTETRRIIKPQPIKQCNLLSFENGVATFCEGWHHRSADCEPDLKIKCPYSVQQRLWTRETWADLRGMGFGSPVAYRADGLNAYGCEDGDSKRARLDYGVKWKPSIHMPRWASRDTLEVTEVRAERVQDITEEEAWAEGVKGYGIGNPDVGNEWVPATEEFAKLWNSIHGPDAWDRNDWVWVVRFRRL